MKEAEDFLPGGSRLEADLDLPGIIAGHTTPVLKDDAENVTPMTALRCYLTFAQEQFAAAAGREVAGSMALHALGKLHAALAQKKGTPIVAPESKAMVFYQAALLVYPKNYMAANDLGVLLAQCGHYADARAMLEHSLSLCPQSTGWQNLAVVYRQLGQTALAERAARQATLLRQAEIARRQASPAAANDAVQWVDPQTFAQTSTNTPNSPGATAAAGERRRTGGRRRTAPTARQPHAGGMPHAPAPAYGRRPRRRRPSGCRGERRRTNDESRTTAMKLKLSYPRVSASPRCRPTPVPRAAFRPAGVGGVGCGVLARGLGNSGKGRSDGCGHSGGASPCRSHSRRASPQ